MKRVKLADMHRGWFIGDFEPTLARTTGCEVAVKYYSAGDAEKKHYHKIATEYTVVVEGKIQMFDVMYHKGDIIICEPNDCTDFKAITDAVTTVVKIPAVKGDKYIWKEED